ncbi:class C beta-lactamase-related serine hydrolase [Cytophagaceae bacterium 50C-KIRBA]|uniref:Class C beta-lactamase-related serine hydrolase n=1 Tax=Aquirufa beregesia TaxID=2516556 RepID=A0ABX0EXI2_9BACT|nr:serine hydrolase [Aquirufa beregesia]NGZ45310.1 class C beta-lactamase-related serine hydrolase [Aquirufa beregesia]
MKKLSLLFLLTGIWCLSISQNLAQSLVRSTPEAEGVSSAAIEQFIDSFDAKKHELHSVMILRHGKVIAEAWWKPYAANLKHSMYSVSKSWTSTAIGFAVAEKKIQVSDKVINYFPEYPDLANKPYIADLSIQNLLTMSVGHEVEPLRGVVATQTDWVKGFLSASIAHQPGTKFLYNTLATYMLSAIIQKVTGQKVVDYLDPRLFKPLGIQGVDWEVDPQGINTGGWGIRVKTEDMAKLGQLYLQQGKWKGKQILPAAWVAEATSKHIDQDPSASAEKKSNSDWLQGYGYQFWRCRNGAFRADGAYGQYIVMMPEQDAVVVITSESHELQDDLNMVWKHLLPAFEKNALTPNPIAQKQLKSKLSQLQLIAPAQDNAISSTTWNNPSVQLDKNALNVEQIGFQWIGEKLNLQLMDNKQQKHLIPVGHGTWAETSTEMPGPYLLRAAKANLEGQSPFKVASSYRWIGQNTLEITLRFYESPHHWVWTCQLDHGQFKMEIKNSFDRLNTIKVSGNVKL